MNPFSLKKTVASAAIACALAGAASASHAAVLITNGSGTITGVSDVMLGTKTYDVSFGNTVSTPLLAAYAADALSQIEGVFSSSTAPNSIKGCSNLKNCYITFPVTTGGYDYLQISTKNGLITGNESAVGQGKAQVTYAIFTAVPEPATWAMMLVGFGMIGFAMRARRQQKVRVTYA